MIGIYAFYRRSDNKCLYVGQSKNLEHRTYAHTCPSGIFYNQDVYYKIIEIFDFYDLDNQLDREAYWINKLNPELNKIRNRTWNEEQREEIRQRNTGTTFTPERCKHISESLKGKKRDENFKQKRKEHMKGNTLNNGRIHINKDGVNKNVKQVELQYYLDLGWNLGWKIKKINKKWMNDGKRNIYVKPEEIKKYESQGWQLGFFSVDSNKKWMNDGKHNKYIKPEEIKKYESQGWKLGFISKKDK